MKNTELFLDKNVPNSKTKNTKHNYFIFVLFILAILVFWIYFIVTYFFPSNLKTVFPFNSDINIVDSHTFDNASYLSSNNFSINSKDEITEIKGTITNHSNDTLRNLSCVYSLLDASNNVVLKFDIYISNIKANSSSVV